ncbi:hypothetical protein SUNI508_11137 [Seiridium unicorne]|uniref:Uncharacterized protein n=1 Tax=Seiridium unicorne TaxID=138068 RepID=A0ABR2UJ97_9PEZI
MPELEGSLFPLESIRGKSLTPRKIDILNALASESANEAVRRIDGCCPPLTETEDAADYLWAVWQIIVNVVTSPDATSEIYEHLVSVLQGLTQVAKGELLVWTGIWRVWTDLPLFPQCMETYDKNPIAEGDELTPESLHVWRNWSSFSARCMGAGVLGMYVQQIDALRGALEEELDIEQDVAKTECQLQVAFEWIAYTARNLLWWAQENIGLVDVAMDSTQYFPGFLSLLEGKVARVRDTAMLVATSDLVLEASVAGVACQIRLFIDSQVEVGFALGKRYVGSPVTTAAVATTLGEAVNGSAGSQGRGKDSDEP